MRGLVTVVLVPLLALGCGSLYDEEKVAVVDAGADVVTIAPEASTPSKPDAAGAVDAGAPAEACPLGCLPPAPDGWTGPSAVYDGSFASAPSACPPLYTRKETEAFQVAPIAPATCACGAAVPSNVSCSFGVQAFASTNCMGAYASFTTAASPGGACTPTNPVPGPDPVARSLIARLPASLAGSCASALSKTIAAPSYERKQIACGLPQIGSCAGRPDCTASPIPDAPFTRLCIHREGTHDCPSSDYSSRVVGHQALTDDRGCSACTSTFSGTCASTWPADAAGCGGGGIVQIAFGACYDESLAAKVLSPAAMPAPTITCGTPTGGTPTGTAALERPVTFCCNK